MDNDNKKSSIHFIKTVSNMANEFASCSDFNKFDPRSNVRFKNGDLMGVWFANNMQKIFSYKGEVSAIIKNQYLDYKRCSDYKKEDSSHEVLQRRRYFYLFLKTNNINKFNFYSGVTFPDGSLTGVWFYCNKDKILSSDDDAVCCVIKKQYFNYLQFADLKLQFLHAPKEKFCFDGCVRFKTGAIMNFWWETYKDDILSSKDEVSIKIKAQFESFNNIYDNENKGLVKKY